MSATDTMKAVSGPKLGRPGGDAALLLPASNKTAYVKRREIYGFGTFEQAKAFLSGRYHQRKLFDWRKSSLVFVQSLVSHIALFSTVPGT